MANSPDQPGFKTISKKAREVSAEVLFFCVTLALIVCLRLIFEDFSYFLPLFVVAIIAHLSVGILRRLRIGVAVSAVFSLFICFLGAIWTLYPASTRFGLPWRESFATVGGSIRRAVDLVGVSEIPLPVHSGLLFMLAILTWLIVFLGDWGAFRIFSLQFEVLAPALGMFVLLSFFGEGTARVWYALLVIAVVVLFSTVHPARRFEPGRATSSFPSGKSRGLGGGLMAIGAVLASLLGTSIAYEYLQDSPYDMWRNRISIESESAARVVPSPLVSVRSQLRGPLSEQRLFNVRSNSPSYWRLTALESFDGETWSLRATHSAVRDNEILSSPTPSSSISVTELRQSFSMDALSSVWLPAAYQPVSIVTDSSRVVRFAAETSTLLLESGFSDEIAYNVTSASAGFEADYLRGLGETDLRSVRLSLLEIPASVSERVRQVALYATAGATFPYERALALQNWLRENYEYSLEVPAGHSGSHLDQFLFEWRRGYCEHFATAFAAMGRVAGLPTRVAVGFTPGEALQSYGNGDMLFEVRGKHAHTWPEVYIDGAGWVAFEPTPGRGAPGTESYTGVPAQQDASPMPPVTTTPATDGPGVETSPPPTSNLLPSELEETAPRLETNQTSTQRPAWMLPVLVILGVLGLYLLSAAGLYYRRTVVRRRIGAQSHRGRVLVGWETALELLEIRGLRRRAAENARGILSTCCDLLRDVGGGLDDFRGDGLASWLLLSP